MKIFKLDTKNMSNKQLMVAMVAVRVGSLITPFPISEMFVFVSLVILAIFIGRVCRTDFPGKVWNVFVGAVIIDMFRSKR